MKPRRIEADELCELLVGLPHRDEKAGVDVRPVKRRGPLRGMLLKGNGFFDIAPDLWPIAVFTLVVAMVAVWSYRVTLD